MLSALEETKRSGGQVLAVTADRADYSVLLAGMAAAGLIFLVLTAVRSRRHLPVTTGRPQPSDMERSTGWGA